MYEESLLERIRFLDRHPGQADRRDAARGVRSIIGHLSRMLNTRQGSVSIAEDYGMPDITNFPGDTVTETAEGMEKMIREAIRKYEPRLSDVRITFDPDENNTLAIRFKLEGVVAADDGRRRPVIIETVVTSSGMIRLEA